MEASTQVLLATLAAALLLARHGRARVPPRQAAGQQRPALLAAPARQPTAAWLPTDDAVEDPLR